MEMHKKYIVSLLIPALLIQLYGCYSMKEISEDEIAGLKEGGDLIVYTKDSTIYSFKETNYHISTDSIYGKGYAKFTDASDFKAVNKGAIALANIKTIQRDELNLVTTCLLIGGILLAVIVGVVILFPSTHMSEVPVSPTYGGGGN
jgi:hypothetical protein